MVLVILQNRISFKTTTMKYTIKENTTEDNTPKTSPIKTTPWMIKPLTKKHGIQCQEDDNTSRKRHRKQHHER